SCERFVDEAGPADILVNAAGLALGREPFSESTEQDERTVFETNVNGLVRMTRLVLQRSLREPGHIVNMGSIAGRWAYPNGASYITSKFAVRGFTRALREDLLGRDIRITTVDAGLVETEFSLVRFRGDAEQAKAVYNGARPLPLSSGQVEYFSAAFYLRNPIRAGLEHDVLSIVRSRFVGESMQDGIAIRNESMETQRFEVGIEIGCDFADIFTVKDHDFTLGDPVNAPP